MSPQPLPAGPTPATTPACPGCDTVDELTACQQCDLSVCEDCGGNVDTAPDDYEFHCNWCNDESTAEAQFHGPWSPSMTRPRPEAAS